MRRLHPGVTSRPPQATAGTSCCGGVRLGPLMCPCGRGRAVVHVRRRTIPEGGVTRVQVGAVVPAVAGRRGRWAVSEQLRGVRFQLL